MTAAIMIAARVARGIKLKYGVRKSSAKITNTPENKKIDTYYASVINVKLRYSLSYYRKM